MPLPEPAPLAALRLHPDDDVAVCVRALETGETVLDGVVVREAIPAGHKLALRDLATGSPVRKYGQVIGATTAAVRAGDWVHVHNLGMGDVTSRVAADAPTPSPLATQAGRTFQGYLRADGRVGTRNYLAVVTSVNCSAMVARRIAREVEARLGDDYPNIDGVVAVTHGSGCAMESSGEAMDVLRRTLAGYARHPNVAGVLMLGLGCETNQLSGLTDAENLASGDTLSAMTIQGEGGTSATIAAGIARMMAMAEAANALTRTPQPLSGLVVGLQCGGSDGYSGVTANPALGHAVDRLVAEGGTAILSETPEIYGAEHLLTRRAADPSVTERLMGRIAWWERHVAATGGSMDNNPSAGNKAGGLTTILEKSLGAVAKAGASPLSAVYGYAEPVTEAGLVFMDTPGYDPVSATGQIAGGANLICFTTGRGSVFGAKPAPSLKLATNTAMYRRMADDMDLDCGEILSAGVSIPAMGERILDLMIRTASGEPSRSEALGFGEDEIQPWRIGAVM
ncbi:UxaA family hydrolase [Brevundimonas subvibrioides]|uniref:Galactarate dehydratase n=1 Tax=Brevundimonas subvibrioides (strain ATCC 15264 / DSM 4735 / LMG 14903 / NBRC 16000 / CB 81) TaxID=633149 RepID=D9QNM6_BRESC|nr:altronate dehydratase family protein [Brevundimonas subvibrioides]ADL02261.1 Galactarate dehydratase [Brevundimonas subvibrioides ATCC 15264]